jgi:hypothetical protein
LLRMRLLWPQLRRKRLWASAKWPWSLSGGNGRGPWRGLMLRRCRKWLGCLRLGGLCLRSLCLRGLCLRGLCLRCLRTWRLGCLRCLRLLRLGLWGRRNRCGRHDGRRRLTADRQKNASGTPLREAFAPQQVRRL